MKKNAVISAITIKRESMGKGRYYDMLKDQPKTSRRSTDRRICQLVRLNNDNE